MQIASKAPPTIAPAAPPEKLIAVTLQLPPEKHDYVADFTSGGIGLLGALLGAYAAYLFGTRAADKTRAKDDREKDLFLSFSALHKLQKIYPAQVAIGQHITEARAAQVERLAAARRAGAELQGNHLSLYASAYANQIERVSFTAEEIMRAGKVGGKEVLNALMIIDERHNVTADLLDVYRNQKIEFGAKSNPKAVFADGYMHFTWTPDQYRAVQPLLYLMDNTLTAIEQGVEEDAKAAYDASVALIQGRARLTGGKGETKVRAPDGTYMIVTANAVTSVPEKNEAAHDA